MTAQHSSVKARRFRDLVPGEVIVSDGLTIGEAQIVTFAGLVGDYYPWHMDDRLAQASPFGARIAHAPLTLSIAAGLTLRSDPLDAVAFLGITDCSFVHPVVLGDTIYARSTYLDGRVTSDPTRSVVRHQREVFNQDDRLVASYETRVMVNV